MCDISKKILVLSAVIILQSTTFAFALDDGWYAAKSATGPCTGAMMRSTVAVEQGAPISISFTSESLSFVSPIKASKTPKPTKIADSGGQFDVIIAETSKNILSIKLLTGDCPGSEVLYTRR